VEGVAAKDERRHQHDAPEYWQRSQIRNPLTIERTRRDTLLKGWNAPQRQRYGQHQAGLQGNNGLQAKVRDRPACKHRREDEGGGAGATHPAILEALTLCVHERQRIGNVGGGRQSNRVNETDRQQWHEACGRNGSERRHRRSETAEGQDYTECVSPVSNAASDGR
jgi:hypothetical protein